MTTLGLPTDRHALRQGHLCARNVAATYGGTAGPFRYRDQGLAVTLGRSRGTLVMMPGVAPKARVITDWTISTAFPRHVAQLGALGRPSPPE